MSNCIPITQADLPLVITVSGDYCVTESLNFTGSTDAITVSVSNVNLDFQGYQLKYTGVDYVNGVHVLPYLRNVNTFNGIITGFTSSNIWYDEGDDSFQIYDMVIEECAEAGVYLGPFTPSSNPADITKYVSNATLTNCSILRNFSGLYIFGRENIYIDNVRCNDSLADNSDIRGILASPIPDDSIQEASFLKNLRIYNSTFNTTQGLGGTIGRGSLSLSGILNPVVKSCTFNNNILIGGFGSASAGLLCSALVNALIEDCQFNNNTWNFSGIIPFLFNGFHTSANARPFGLRDARRITLRNCEAKGNVSQGFVGGIYVGYQENIVLEGNVASGNRSLAVQANPNTGTIAAIPCASGICIDGGAGGFNLANNTGTVSNLVCQNNITNGNVAEQGLGAGIYVLGGNFFDANTVQRNFVFHNNIAQGNVGLADSPTIGGLFVSRTFDGVKGIGAGILIDRGVILNVDNLRLADGLFLTKDTRNFSIKNNTLQGNVFGVAGTDPWFNLTIYGPNQTVSYNGIVYDSLQNNNKGNQPDISPTFWRALLPATGGKYSGGLVLIGIDSGVVLENDATGNTNGFVLTGGTAWNGQVVASTKNMLVENNKAVRNTCYGFVDRQNKEKCKKGCVNAFVKNTAFNNGRNYKIKDDINNIDISRC